MSSTKTGLIGYLEMRGKFGRNDATSYIHRNGRPFRSEELTEIEKEYVGTISRGDNPTKQCYRNSQMAALTARPREGIELRYVEGMVDAGLGVPLDHAWLSVNGKVVDLTIRVEGEAYDRVHGIMPTNWEYYGVEMDTGECRHCLEHGKHVPLIDDWECGWPKLAGMPTDRTFREVPA